MKIVFVMTQSLDDPSGLGRFGPLAREMARLGHQVEVLALHPAWRDLARKVFTESGIRVRYVGQMHVMKRGPRKHYYGPAGLLWISLASTLRLARALARSDAEIIQLCKPQPYNVMATRLAGRGRPIYCDCDDYEAETNVFSSSWQKRIVRYFEDGIVGQARGLTVNTSFSRQRYTELGFPEQRIVIVPNGVERGRFENHDSSRQLAKSLGLHAGQPVVCYVGSLGLRSHPVDLLLEAFVCVLHRIPAARLLLVGGGEDFDQLRQMGKKLGIADQTVFTGRVMPAAIPRYLSLATVSVDPVCDNLVAKARSPLKVVESLSLGVPVVTGEVGDRRQLLNNGDLGILVNAGDSQALADGILAVLSNSELRNRMSREAVKYREEWFWDRQVHDFLRVYEL